MGSDPSGEDDGHVVEVVVGGSFVSRWVPGEDGEPEHLDETDWQLEGVVEARCSCGQVFETEAAAMEHLEEVAAEPVFREVDEAALEEALAESSDMSTQPLIGRRSGMPMYAVEIDLFAVRERASGIPNEIYLAGQMVDAVMESSTAADVLVFVEEEVEPPSVLAYDTVCYRPLERGDEEDRVVPRGTMRVQLSSSAVLGDEVPEGRPVRVTNYRYAPYVIARPSE